MFGTVIIDAFKKDEAEEMAIAIDDICSPTDSYGWASAGIYCFWNYYTHDVLYIGLASDLCVRFKQHNGLLPIQDEACKRRQIEEYFEGHERLGYTIFVQLPLSQPLVHRNKALFEKIAREHNTPILDMASEQGRDDIKRVEGILIEAFRAHYGDFPAWNKVGGDTIGQQKVLPNNINIVKSFANPQEYKRNPIVSRSTIRELAESADYELFECNYLHAARMYMFMLGVNYEEALDIVDMFDRFGYREKMIQFGYDKKKLVV